MSAFSKTPDDKMHRYLQRIQKLVGHRGKSPILIKSRTKSPMNIKTSHIDSYLKHEMFFKSIITVWDEHHKKIKTHFLTNLIEINEITQTKRRDSYYSSQTNNKTIKKQNDQPLAIRFITKALQNSISRVLRVSFESIQRYQPQMQSRDTKRLRPHRRTYSEIYAQSVSKYQSKSPTTLRNFQYKTPQVYKKSSVVHVKKAETRLICSLLEKVSVKNRYSAFSQLKTFYCNSVISQINQTQSNLVQSQAQFIVLQNQHSKTIQQLKKANQTIMQQQKTFQLSLANLARKNQEEKSQNDNEMQILQLERILHQTKGLFCIYEILNKKISFRKAFSLQKLISIKLSSVNESAKCLTLQKTLKAIINLRSKQFFNNLNIKSQKSLIPSQSRQVIIQRTYTPSQVRVQSLYSSKQSFSSQKSVTSNFDLFAQKINKAFELKTSLKQIYSYGFQKIDESAFMYLTIANPINKVIKLTLTQSFRKILFYSFYKGQLKQSTIIINESQSFRSTLPSIVQPPAKKNYEKMLLILKKIEKKILFMKIQSYSLLKLNSDLIKTTRLPEDFVISQIDLKRQIKDFLQQRNKMHQKTCETWVKTKQMLQQINHSSSRSSFNSRVKI